MDGRRWRRADPASRTARRSASDRPRANFPRAWASRPGPRARPQAASARRDARDVGDARLAGRRRRGSRSAITDSPAPSPMRTTWRGSSRTATRSACLLGIVLLQAAAHARRELLEHAGSRAQASRLELERPMCPVVKSGATPFRVWLCMDKLAGWQGHRHVRVRDRAVLDRAGARARPRRRAAAAGGDAGPRVAGRAAARRARRGAARRARSR